VNAAISSVLPETGPDLAPGIAPQPRQYLFLKANVDIAVYGGAAGAGKSYALLLEPLYHVSNPLFGAVIFRRTYPQIKNEGGLWDTSETIYPICGGSPRGGLKWHWPSGANIAFAHMQHEQDRYQWDGAQIALIEFDQLEHFTWRQFSYMLSKNRSVCGVDPYIRATCNPDPDSWLRDFMRWWIDDDTGLPIQSRGGVVRWFVILNNEVLWADDPSELRARYGEKVLPKSFTFIPGSIHDNIRLLEKNPDYLANLEALHCVDRERLLFGNWNARDTAGAYFHPEWFEIIKAAPPLEDQIRYWDRAATPAESNPATKQHGSATAGCRMGTAANGLTIIEDMVRFWGSPLMVEETVKNVASQDTQRIRIGIEEDPGQAGKAEAQYHVRNLKGYDVTVNAVRESKGRRARPLAAQAEAGNVKLVEGRWNEAFLREAENFDGSDRCASDQIDAASGAFHLLNSVQRAGVWGRR
jgi:predicted phage terminase large subunit-like protein